MIYGTRSPIFPILDPGHGMMFALSGGRHIVDDRGNFYEGEFNRAIFNRVIEQLVIKSIPFYTTCYTIEDVTLTTRYKKANAIYAEHPDTYVLSIHSNAGGGQGCEVWTSEGDTAADPIATHFGLLYKTWHEFVPYKLREDRTDKDLDKEKNYTILYKSIPPAILWEFFFFDVKEQRHMLMDPAFRQIIANFLVKGIELLASGQIYQE